METQLKVAHSEFILKNFTKIQIAENEKLIVVFKKYRH